MAKVLVLYSSPLNKGKSISGFATKKFIEEYKKNNPDDEIKELNLNDLEMAQTGMNANNFSNFFDEEFSNKYIEMLKSIDKLVISAPMINFNVPSVLKTFIDRVAVANKTFSYKYSKKGGAIGLLDHLKVQIIATQGAPLGWYLWTNHISYLEGVWDFLGAKIAKSILIDGTKVEPFISLTNEEIIAQKADLIKKAAADF
ncbi:Acyl carrier protein phosphodiesterase [Metamycoplasma alkalescens 14918]|uniref:FMN dependent NADH:quinone oxidoreductase n=1 Tax=Metamycoplasma alkalescens 14918 TaxID=1188234 RepID=N9UBF5_9BACT|nr:FMN-dependent NADH-azoreductase [Metamycoplasma alkalescens]ENY54056.1 Acyl carrier protein phosphodiesterase [Metamycoplasma alkalescens 14918]